MTEGLGSILVRTKPELHRTLKQEAQRRRVSLNQLCNELLQAARKTPPRAGEIDKWSPIVRRIKEDFGDQLEGLVLFGSVARGEQTDRSDVDLLLVLSS